MKNKKQVVRKKQMFRIGGFLLIIVAIVLFIVLVTREDKMICTSTSNQESSGYVLNTKYIVRSKNGVVHTVKIQENITSSDEAVLKQFEEQFNNQYSYNSKNYGGYTYKVVRRKKEVNSRVTIDYNKMDLKKFSETNVAMKLYMKNGKVTTSGIKKLYESTGAVCK